MTKKTCSECFWFDPSTSHCKADAEPVYVDKETEACESFDEKFERWAAVITVGNDCQGCENVLDTDMQTRSCPHKGTDTCKQMKEQKRPSPLPEPALTYRTEDSVHPDQIRMSFSDGSTAIYDLRTELPHPAMMKNHEIMAKWSNKGYNNQPARRRRRKP